MLTDNFMETKGRIRVEIPKPDDWYTYGIRLINYFAISKGKNDIKKINKCMGIKRLTSIGTKTYSYYSH